MWRFGSDVLRDVAYDALAKRERQRLHLRVANKLLGAEAAATATRARSRIHLEQAALAALDLDPARPHARRARRRGARARGRPGAPPDRVALGRRSLRARARALRAAGGAGASARPGSSSMLGESRYWLGEFDPAEDGLPTGARRSRGDRSDRVCAHASRFLADITLTIRGDDAAAAAAVRAGARGRPAPRRSRTTLARTLLMAGWVPFWRNDLERAESMFREALEVARSREPTRRLGRVARAGGPRERRSRRRATRTRRSRSAWRRSRSGEEAGQAFTAAVAHETVAALPAPAHAAGRGARARRGRHRAPCASWARGGSWRARSATAA